MSSLSTKERSLRDKHSSGPKEASSKRDRSLELRIKARTEEPVYEAVREHYGTVPPSAEDDYVEVPAILEYHWTREDDPSMSKPVLFYGKPGQLDQVIAFCEVKFGTDDTLIEDKAKQASYLASLFRGPALSWLANELKINRSTLLLDYPTFAEQVKSAFGQSDRAEQLAAQRSLNTLSQRTSVLQYKLRFQQLARQAGYEETEQLINQFLRGLKLHVKEALITRGQNYATIEQCAQQAQRIDDELFAAKRDAGSTKYSKAGSSLKCYNCGKIGHKARDCKSKQGSGARTT